MQPSAPIINPPRTKPPTKMLALEGLPVSLPYLCKQNTSRKEIFREDKIQLIAKMRNKHVEN